MRLVMRSTIVWAVLLGLAGVARAQDPAEATPEPPVTDPAALAVLETEPQTPSELMRATMILIDLKQARAARPLVGRLIEAALDEEQLADLHDQYGSAVFLKLSLEPELQPQAATFARSVTQAADQRARNPERLAALIKQLSDAEPLARQVAAARLKSGGDAAISALIAVLADPARADEHDAVRRALAGFGADATPALAAVVQSASGDLKVQALRGLGETRDPKAIMPLYVPALDPQEPQASRDAAIAAIRSLGEPIPPRLAAAAKLYAEAEALLNRPDSFAGDMQVVRFWTWDDQQRQAVVTEASANDAAMALALRRARGAYLLSPESADSRQLYYIARMEAASRSPAGPDLSDFDALQISDVEAILRAANKQGHSGAAAVAVRLLGKRAGLEALHRESPRPSMLVEALNHTDAGVRFAALETIMELNPTEPYPGSSRVVEALSHFVTASRPPCALVAHRKTQEAARLAGLLQELGFETEIATDPRSFIQLAISSAACELAVIDIALTAPGSGEIITSLRRDARTARMPIMIVLNPGQELLGDKVARRHPLVRTLMSPQDVRGMDSQLRMFLDELEPTASPETREQRAIAALTWLTQISQAAHGEASQSIYRLDAAMEPVSAAIWDPKLCTLATSFLAEIGTRDAQRLLVDFASQTSQPIELRRAAGAAFTLNVTEHGTQLTSDEILRQYDRYNRSETLDKDTQQLLGSILDAIEARAALGPPVAATE